MEIERCQPEGSIGLQRMNKDSTFWQGPRDTEECSDWHQENSKAIVFFTMHKNVRASPPAHLSKGFDTTHPERLLLQFQFHSFASMLCAQQGLLYAVYTGISLPVYTGFTLV